MAGKESIPREREADADLFGEGADPWMSSDGDDPGGGKEPDEFGSGGDGAVSTFGGDGGDPASTGTMKSLLGRFGGDKGQYPEPSHMEVKFEGASFGLGSNELATQDSGADDGTRDSTDSASSSSSSSTNETGSDDAGSGGSTGATGSTGGGATTQSSSTEEPGPFDDLDPMSSLPPLGEPAEYGLGIVDLSAPGHDGFELAGE